MHVSCLPGKEASMYPGSIRSNNHSLPAQSFASGTPYTDYMGYHHAQSLDDHGQPSGGWGSPYSLQREDWNPYGPGPGSSTSGPAPGPSSYTAANYNSLNPAASSIDTIDADHISPHNQRLRSYDWMRKAGSSNNAVKAYGIWVVYVAISKSVDENFR
ncbi:UNVERIFIED_CONTAM: hypothetical protein K2H54_049517 [Gekko kuhli]